MESNLPVVQCSCENISSTAASLPASPIVRIRSAFVITPSESTSNIANAIRSDGSSNFFVAKAAAKNCRAEDNFSREQHTGRKRLGNRGQRQLHRNGPS